MIEGAVYASCGILGYGVLLALYRLITGPTVLDRLLAYDLLTNLVLALIAAMTILLREYFFVEALLMFSILGFLSVSAIVFHLDETLPDRVGMNDDGVKGDAG